MRLQGAVTRVVCRGKTWLMKKSEPCAVIRLSLTARGARVNRVEKTKMES